MGRAKSKEYSVVSRDGRASEEGEEGVGERKGGVGKKVVQQIYNRVPIIHWLPRYQWKENLSGDVIAGLTVGIMHVPQGMAYASLAGVPPVYGMYSSFFACLVYMIFGTSRHISIGVFAVASLMVGAVRLRLLPEDDGVGATVEQVMELTSSLTLAVGLVQLVFAGLHLGFLTAYLSDPLISGFTTGSAVHVMASQLNKVFGVRLPRHEGAGMLPRMLRDLFFSLPDTNWMALGVSVFGMAFLSLGRDYLNPVVKRYSAIPVPLELILVILGTAFSTVVGLHANYGVKIVEHVPRGLPMPSPPSLTLLPSLLPDAIPIAIICYMFVMSMGKLFAKKHKYKTDPTQELFALGVMEVCSSFFPVYPVGASLSRSAVCELSGARTQLYTVFSSSLLLLVILFLGPFLEPLPMCILACIVIVSLKSLFMQCTELPRLWKISKFDFAIWLIACLCTILTDVTKGLALSVVFSILSVILREQWPAFSCVELSEAPPQHVPSDVKLVKFHAPLHFANVWKFTDTLSELMTLGGEKSLIDVRNVLVDCSAISFIDSMGVDAIWRICQDAKKNNMTIVFCCMNDSILEMLQSIDFFSTIDRSLFQPIINEALIYVSKIDTVGTPL